MRHSLRRSAPLLGLALCVLVEPLCPESSVGAMTAVGGTSLRSPTPPSSAVPIAPDADPQALVAKYPAGTSFIIESGVHADFSVLPKSEDTFYAAAGAVLDGLGVAPSAFRERRSTPALGVAIIGASVSSPLVVQHYGSAAAAQVAAIQPLPGNRVPTDSAWWLQWVDVQHNAARGISLTTGMTIVDCSVLDNGRLGIGGGGTHITIQGNEVSGNGIGVTRAGFEAGGIKTVGNDVTIADNRISGNGAPGIWTDDDGTGDIIAGNTVSKNTIGIEIEISSEATVSQNTLSGNTQQAVLIVASSQITVANNRLNGNRAGILVGGAYRTGPNGVHLHSVTVRSNQVVSSGVTGLHQLVPSSAAISFNRDHFVGGRFQWQGHSVTFAQWQATGQERRGTWVP
jgi:parallel beta-helix repeat protein